MIDNIGYPTNVGQGDPPDPLIADADPDANRIALHATIRNNPPPNSPPTDQDNSYHNKCLSPTNDGNPATHHTSPDRIYEAPILADTTNATTTDVAFNALYLTDIDEEMQSFASSDNTVLAMQDNDDITDDDTTKPDIASDSDTKETHTATTLTPD